jgi:hypothetical protein
MKRGREGGGISTPQQREAAVIDALEDVADPELEHLEDYILIRRAVAELRAARRQTIDDIQQLVSLREAAMADPLGFVARLQTGSVSLPARSPLPAVPELDFYKYLYVDRNDRSSVPVPARAYASAGPASAGGLSTPAPSRAEAVRAGSSRVSRPAVSLSPTPVSMRRLSASYSGLASAPVVATRASPIETRRAGVPW